MKLMFASDIHGNTVSAEKMLDAFGREGAEKLIILGDILYFGPRNSLIEGYDPRAVIELLNKNRDKLLCVRGNCDAEVDQMVLDFPVMAEYAYLCVDGISAFLTHGHIHNKETLKNLRRGELLIHGHTHVWCIEEFGDGNIYINPGSVTYPKGGNPASYMIYENGTFTIKTLDGGVPLGELKIEI